MSSVGQMLNRVKSFNRIEAAGEAMKDNEQDILNLNRDQLYDKGIGKDAMPLPPYTAAYAKAKPSRGLVDIYKTGKLQKEMELNISGNNYELNSPVAYAQFVVGKRPTVFGLTVDAKKEAQIIILPEYVEKLKEWTGMR